MNETLNTELPVEAETVTLAPVVNADGTVVNDADGNEVVCFVQEGEGEVSFANVEVAPTVAAD